MRVTLEVHANIPAFSCEFWSWSLGFMLVKQVLSYHPIIKTKIISKVWEQSKRTTGFSVIRCSFIWKLFPSFVNANVWKYSTFSEKTVVTSHRCLRLTTDKQIVLRGSTSVNCTLSFWVLQSGKIRASFIFHHSGTFWNKWICSISTPKQQGFTTLKWQLLWS